eukprot:m.263740 g.263740  ORF g.263740 m.263740 type:complete len:116 (-) comp16227_c0_seq92:670-1017(-)
MRKANTQTGVSSAQSNDAPSVSTVSSEKSYNNAVKNVQAKQNNSASIDPNDAPSKSVDASDMSGDAGADISDAISTGSDIAAASEGGLNPNIISQSSNGILHLYWVNTLSISACQ